jgi:hypothetical protein
MCFIHNEVKGGHEPSPSQVCRSVNCRPNSRDFDAQFQGDGDRESMAVYFAQEMEARQKDQNR